MDRPLHLLIVTGAFPVRSQAFIVNKVVGLARRGHVVTVLAARPGDHALDPTTLAKLEGRLRVEYQPAGRSPRTLAQAFRSLARAKAQHPDFVLKLAASVVRSNGLGAAARRRMVRGAAFAGRSADVVHFEWVTKAAECPEVLDLLSAPTVVSCRGSDVRVIAPEDPRLARELPGIFATVDAVHCVSAAVVTAAEGLGMDPGKAFVNRPAVDCQFFAGRPDRAASAGPVRIVSVGRLHWVKGYDHALQAIRLLVDRGCDVTYTIVGDGDPESRAAVRFDVRDLGLRGRVELAGALSPPEVRRRLAASDVFLLASLSEGLSNSTLEAMAMELPVVATDVGGMGEVVREGVDGHLVPSRDAAAMADRLERLVVDPAQRARLGAAGRARVCESFSLEAQLDTFVDKYRQLVAERTRTG